MLSSIVYLDRARKFVMDFFTKGHQRTLEAKKNIAASFFIKGASIVINLALVPLTINYVNPTQYGIWLTLSSIVAWFSFFDIGFGHGLRNRFAEAKATGNNEKARIYVSTTYAVLTLIFTGVWVLFYTVNFFVDWSKILNAPAELATELSTLSVIVLSFFSLQIVLKTINTIIIADQKPAKAAFFDMLGQLIALITIFILTKTTQGSLIYLGLGLGAAPIFILILSSFIFYSKRYKYFAPALKYVQFSYAKDILGLGFKFFIIQIANVVVYQTINIIIAQTSGPDEVTVFNVVYKYFGIMVMAFSIITTPFWSAFTEAYQLNETSWMLRTYKKLKFASFLAIGGLIIMILLSNILIKIWVGDFIKINYLTSSIIAFYTMTIIWNMFHVFILNGMGKIKIELYISVLITLINLPLAIFLGKKFGLNGVITSVLLLNLIGAVIIPIQINKLLNNRAKGIWSK